MTTTEMTAGQPSVDSSAYQTFLTVSADGDIVKRVEEQLESWLRSKGRWDPPTESTGFHTGPAGQELLVLHHQNGMGRELRVRLQEPTHNGSWRTSLTLHVPPAGDAWIGLRVANSQGRFAAVPRLAGYLLDALEVRDGETWLASEPVVVRGPDVEQVAEELCHVDRQGLFFVAGTDERLPFDPFSLRVRTWTREVRGLAHVVVLDPEATASFNEIMGSSHEAPPWTIRTYGPDVDPAVVSDGRRHKILGTKRLAGSDVSTRALLGRIARAHASQQPPPERYTTVHRALLRLEDQMLVESLVTPEKPARELTETTGSPNVPAVPSLPAEAESYLAQIALVRETLGVASLDRAELERLAQLVQRGIANSESIDRITRQLEERREQIGRLESELEWFRVLSDDQEEDLTDALEAQAKLRDESRWLRSRLVELQDFSDGFGQIPDDALTSYPANFAELVDRLPEMELLGVVFTGDSKGTSDLDEHDPIGRLARVTWDCLLALADYVHARNSNLCTQGVEHYLRNTPPECRSVPPKKYAAKETNATMNAWGDQRCFPVPLGVDPSGLAVMEAHFKLGKVGMVSPRMYYLDNWASDRKLYVGYIGTHLRNTQTN